MNKDEIEEQLKVYLGVKKVIWLPRGLYGILPSLFCIRLYSFSTQSYNDWPDCQIQICELVLNVSIRRQQKILLLV